MTFNINANGVKEVNAAGVPGQGDPDGTATGTLTLDNVAGSATINITVANLDLSFTGNHVHQAPPTTTGAIVLDFGDPDNYRVGNLISGTVTGLSIATINSVFANPSNFYYNIHNTPFPGGAARDQLAGVPEPSSLGLAALGLLAAAVFRRRCVNGTPRKA
jgi:hypothetical protein